MSVDTSTRSLPALQGFSAWELYPQLVYIALERVMNGGPPVVCIAGDHCDPRCPEYMARQDAQLVRQGKTPPVRPRLRKRYVYTCAEACLRLSRSPWGTYLLACLKEAKAIQEYALLPVAPLRRTVAGM